MKASKGRKSSLRRREIDAEASPFRLEIRRSPIHRLGVFAKEAIPERRRVIEYAGKRLAYGQILKDFRRRRQSGLRKLTYLLRLNRRWVIDGSVGGNGAELINHCCDPNLSRRRVRGHVLFCSRRKVRAGEELTLDYRFDQKAQVIPCHCGSPKCRGTINRKPRRRRARAAM